MDYFDPECHRVISVCCSSLLSEGGAVILSFDFCCGTTCDSPPAEGKWFDAWWQGPEAASRRRRLPSVGRSDRRGRAELGYTLTIRFTEEPPQHRRPKQQWQQWLSDTLLSSDVNKPWIQSQMYKCDTCRQSVGRATCATRENQSI